MHKGKQREGSSCPTLENIERARFHHPRTSTISPPYRLPGRLIGRGRQGLSLIEVLVALGAVAVGILALMAVFITGTRSNEHGQDLSRATYYARKIAETVRQDGLVFAQIPFPPNAASGLNDATGVFRPVADPTPLQLGTIRLPKLAANGAPVLDGLGNPVLDPADAKFQRNIQIRRASTVATAYNYNLLIMDVTVRWQGGKSGDGMRKVKITTMLKAGS